MRRRQDGRERGSVAVLMGLALAVLVGFAAIGVDVGRMYIVREQIHNAADGAVLAGVQALPGDPQGAVETARLFLARNGLDGSRASVSVDPANDRKLHVSVSRSVEMTFARVLGIERQEVSGHSAAERLNATEVYGAVPLSVSKDQDFQFGNLITLKAGAGDAFSPGNFGAIQLGRPGANQYREHLQYGFKDWVSAGNWYLTEPGNLAGPTAEALNYRIRLDPYATYDRVDRNSPRLLRIPVIDAYPNGKHEFQCVGFAVFFLEGARRRGREDEVTGRFLRFDVLGRGRVDAPGYGAYVTRLSP